MRLLLLSLLIIFLTACSNTPTRNKETLVEVNGKELSYQEVYDALPKNLNSEDSTKLVEEYTTSWIKHRLLLQKAELNVGDDPKIEELVKSYREQLLIENYLQLLVEIKAEIKPTEKQINDFYEKNKTQYELQENLLKGIFIVLPLDASNKATLMKLLKTDETERPMIEAYCLQNAAKVDFFQDKWVPFRIIKKHLPDVTESEERILSRRTFFETKDSLFDYIIKIQDYKFKGDISPLNYIHSEIEEFLINNNKISYLRKMEKDLYDDAKRKGLIHDNR